MGPLWSLHPLSAGSDLTPCHRHGLWRFQLCSSNIRSEDRDMISCFCCTSDLNRLRLRLTALRPSARHKHEHERVCGSGSGLCDGLVDRLCTDSRPPSILDNPSMHRLSAPPGLCVRRCFLLLSPAVNVAFNAVCLRPRSRSPPRSSGAPGLRGSEARVMWRRCPGGSYLVQRQVGDLADRLQEAGAGAGRGSAVFSGHGSVSAAGSAASVSGCSSSEAAAEAP